MANQLVDNIKKMPWTNEQKVNLFWDLVAEIQRLEKLVNKLNEEGR